MALPPLARALLLTFPKGPRGTLQKAGLCNVAPSRNNRTGYKKAPKPKKAAK